jgi:hypothetical protein
MAYKPLDHNERVKINALLDARHSPPEARKAFMNYYEWHGKKTDTPAYNIFLDGEIELQERLKNLDLPENKPSGMTLKEIMQKINSIGDHGGNGESARSKYELFFGDGENLGSFARKQRFRFFNSRAFRLYVLEFDIAQGRIADIDDVHGVKAALEKASLSQNLISEERVALIRAMPTYEFS